MKRRRDSEDEIGDNKRVRGTIVVGRVDKHHQLVNNASKLVVKFGVNTFGTVGLSELDDEYLNFPQNKFKHNQFVKAIIINQDLEQNRIELSLKKSRIEDRQVDMDLP